MHDRRHPKLTGVARTALLASALIALGLAGCGPAASAGAAAGSDPAPVPVLTYYLNQTFTALGDEPSPKTEYLGVLRMCKGGPYAHPLPTTPLSQADVEKLATERKRIWQRPNERVEQRDTWQATIADTPNPCLFNGIKEKSVREARVLPQTLYVMDLSKGTVHVQTQAGPPTMPAPPITAAQLKTFESHEATVGDRRKVGDSHAVGQPCAVWDVYNPSHSLWYTECAWTGGLNNGVWPLSLVLWRKPTTTRVGDKWAIKTNEFIVGHLPPDSDEMFKVPAHAKSVGTTVVLGRRP